MGCLFELGGGYLTAILASSSLGSQPGRPSLKRSHLVNILGCVATVHPSLPHRYSGGAKLSSRGAESCAAGKSSTTAIYHIYGTQHKHTGQPFFATVARLFQVSCSTMVIVYLPNGHYKGAWSPLSRTITTAPYPFCLHPRGQLITLLLKALSEA